MTIYFCIDFFVRGPGEFLLHLVTGHKRDACEGKGGCSTKTNQRIYGPWDAPMISKHGDSLLNSHRGNGGYLKIS